MYLAKPLIQGAALTTSAAVYYATPAGTYTRITQFSITNTDTVNHIVSVYLTPTNAAPTTADYIIKNKTLAAGETWVPYQALGAMLAPSGCIQMIADAGTVVIAKASGIELS
jgi:hypothetical protein